jgi:hypothetical protein
MMVLVEDEKGSMFFSKSRRAASRQRSDPAYPHRGLAAEGRRLYRIAGPAVAGLTAREVRFA